MPSLLEQRVEALERQLADMQAMLESLLACVQRQQADAVEPSGQEQQAAKTPGSLRPNPERGKTGQNRTK